MCEIVGSWKVMGGGGVGEVAISLAPGRAGTRARRARGAGAAQRIATRGHNCTGIIDTASGNWCDENCVSEKWGGIGAGACVDGSMTGTVGCVCNPKHAALEKAKPKPDPAAPPSARPRRTRCPQTQMTAAAGRPTRSSS